LMFKQDSIAQGNKRPEGFSTEGKICNSFPVTFFDLGISSLVFES